MGKEARGGAGARCRCVYYCPFFLPPVRCGVWEGILSTLCFSFLCLSTHTQHTHTHAHLCHSYCFPPGGNPSLATPPSSCTRCYLSCLHSSPASGTQVTKKKLDPSCTFLIFEACCSDEEGEDVDLPYIRFRRSADPASAKAAME